MRRMLIWLAMPTGAFTLIVAGYAAFFGRENLAVPAFLLVAAMVVFPILVRGARVFLRSLPDRDAKQWRRLLAWNAVASGGLALTGGALLLACAFRPHLEAKPPSGWGWAILAAFLGGFIGGLLISLLGITRIGKSG